LFSLKDKKLAKDIVSKIKKQNVNYKFMHVCGTHQDTLVKHGLDALLRDCGIDIIFGDMIAVPGENQSLQSMKTEGFDVRTVYGIEDAVDFARNNKDKDVVFMSVGFETTAPTTASVMLNNPPENFSILCCNRTVPNALKAIIEMGEIKINGLIEPGHVSTIIGTEPYEFISKDYGVPQVIAGFEPLDLLMAVYMLVQQIQNGEAFVQNEYSRAVHKKGNTKALEALDKVFESGDIKWRGFPVINDSSLNLKSKFGKWDARKLFEDELISLKDKEFPEPKGCKCGELLRGLLLPSDCPLFGKACKPSSPVGPCMVSIEGSCNIEYRYANKR